MSTTTSTLHSVARDQPEKALLASIIQRAVADAQDGDAAAHLWPQGDDCLAVFVAIAPSGDDPRALQERMLNRLEEEHD